MTANGQSKAVIQEAAGLSAPMGGVLLPSANFAETRPNHLHSGVDVKTGGVEGVPVMAAADGYVSRIGVAPRGFGNTIYVTHKGVTTVYAHLQRFAPRIAEVLKQERYKQKKSALDVYPDAARIPVKRGDIIGYSGNTGSSQGPHLHYEVRDAATQQTMNPVKLGAISFTDNIAPTIVKLHYIEVDSVGVVPVSSPRRTFEVVRGAEGAFSLRQTTPLLLAPNGYFVLEATDRKNGTANTMGIYRVEMSFDGAPTFGFQLDKFAFDQTKYVNSLCHYAMQLGSRNQMLRLAVQQGNLLPVYTHRGGAIILHDDARHRVNIEVEDDSGNISRLAFDVQLREPTAERFTVEGETVDCTRETRLQRDGLRIVIPAGVLYESIFLDIENTPGTTIKPPHYSTVWRVGTAQTPLHRPITVALRADSLPAGLRGKACLGLVSSNGTEFSYAGGTWKDGWVETRSGTFGRFVVAVDDQSPTITVSFADGANLAGRGSFNVAVSDNLSGAASVEGYIDGQWIILEQKWGTYTHFFDPSHFSYGSAARHTLLLKAVDGKGNTATLQRTFVR